MVLRRETAHRGGKIVIVIHDFAPFIGAQSIEDLARKLRSACGCGGTTRQRTIEIQGNQVDRIRSMLEKEGFTWPASKLEGLMGRMGRYGAICFK